MDRDTGRPQWVVEVLAQDNERGEVIRVTVTGYQPKVKPGQLIRFEYMAWLCGDIRDLEARRALDADLGPLKTGAPGGWPFPPERGA